VVAAQVVLDLGQQRNSFEQDLRLAPVDETGQVVEKVTLEPQTVHVRVNIRQRNDVRQVPVRPNILFGTLPQGYFLSSISYEPQTILLSGDLSNVPEAIFTVPIDLTDRKSDFEIAMPVEIPEGNLQVLGTQTITVYVGIAAPTSNRQFENVPIEIIGLAEGFSAHLTPERVTVLITGPQPVLEALQLDDIDVVVDVNGLSEGSHEIVPLVSVKQDLVSTNNIALLPTSVDVEIAPIPEETPALDGSR
jgi:YbbR domain-containing protein